MHIGLIGGIGPAATQFYYRRLVAASKAAGVPFRMTITHADNAPLVQNFLADRRAEQAQVFADHIADLAGAGAQVAAVTALAGHYCIAETVARSPIPLVNALDVVRRDLTAMGIGRIGVLGAGRVMTSGLFGALDPFDRILPEDAEGAGAVYLKMAQRGSCEGTERAFFFAEGRKLIDAGAEAVFLAGTDLFLAFEGHDPGYPVIDGGELHIAELARQAAGQA
ncbi:MAG: aspartate/glutamate racemase family protein [Rhodobacter sp.]|jgi:aspartate racemase|nr:aspartate/glutamate racemase family protein [Rhodobacter sp.]